MHDHATDGGIAGFHDRASARDIRLHLDNSHDFMSSGWLHTALVARHEDFHAAESDRLGEIEAAANLIAERRSAAPPAVVDSIFGDRSLYLTDANDTLYLAEEVDPRHMPAAGPLYRLTAQVDILEQTSSSLAASRAYLDAHKESDGAHQSDSSAGVSAHLAEPAPAGAPHHGGTP